MKVTPPGTYLTPRINITDKKCKEIQIREDRSYKFPDILRFEIYDVFLWQTYVRENPSVIVVDPIESVLQLMNRNKSYTHIQSLELNNGKWPEFLGNLPRKSDDWYNLVLSLRPKKKKSLVVLHRPPLIFENWKKVFIVQKYTAPNFQNSKKKCFFFFENFDLLTIFFKLLLSTCLHFDTGFKLV